MRQPCPCRHIRSGAVKNDGSGVCDPCKINPISKFSVQERRAKGYTTGLKP